jgi:hypothetical protein
MVSFPLIAPPCDRSELISMQKSRSLSVETDCRARSGGGNLLGGTHTVRPLSSPPRRKEIVRVDLERSSYSSGWRTIM